MGSWRSAGVRVIPATLRGYRASWLGADALADLTLVAVALPGQMPSASTTGFLVHWRP